MPDYQHILDDIRKIKSIMIQTATGQAKIGSVEDEYIQLRGRLRPNLASCGIADPNRFASLWDWYGHWKASGLASYQSRRQYVNDLYVAAINAVEALVRGETGDAPEPGKSAVFSERYGYRPKEGQAEITVREEAPQELRRVVVDTAVRAGGDCDDLLLVAARIGKKPWEPTEPRESGVSSRVQLARLVSNWDWYLVYDFIEQICGLLYDWQNGGASQDEFSAILNEYFKHAGIGWQLVQGEITTRGTEAFEAAVHTAVEALEESGLTTSADEIHKALANLSRRPVPDLTGAIQHALAALECTARVASGNPRATLGDVLKRNPGLIPRPLDSAVEKAWGYASEMGRHLQEGREPKREEAELVVGIAATVATYLSRKRPQP